MERIDLKQVRMIDQLSRQPDWVMPDGMHQKLPALLMGFVAKNADSFLKGEMNRDVARAIRLLQFMDAANKAREAPPVQDVNVHIDRDVDQAIDELQAADLSDEELQSLAVVGPILERLERMRGDESN